MPDWVAANMRANARKAKLDPTNNYLIEATLPGTPFSNPKTGAEIMWDDQPRYRGVGIKWTAVRTALSPAPGKTDWITNVSGQWTYHPWGKQGQNAAAANNDLLYGIVFNYVGPAALAGQALALRYQFGNNNQETYG